MVLLQQRRPSAVQAALFLLILLLEPSGLRGFNLDTSHVIRKDGEPGALFGFSLALHQQINPNKVLLLIGAPKARALKNQRSNFTGGLFKCEITESDNCERVEFDNNEDPDQESKEDQWMGVSVQSQGPGGKVVTCAHRYQKRHAGSQSVLGRCYFFSQDLTIDLSSDLDGGDWKLCEGRFGDTDHEMFGMCQQGLGVTFTKDYHYVVFGAPGAKNWQGIVHVAQQNNTLLERGIYDDGPYEFMETKPVLIPAHSYLGFSLDTGHNIMRSRNLTVVAGAPRAQHKGVVVLLKKESDHLLVEHLLNGPGLASSFGYDVAVVDLNGDGWEDIVVGAPHFYMKSTDIGGAVYVYINEAGQWDGVTPTRLNGTKDSMFGLAVENMGDVNQDSFNDIAVGAPQDDEGAGKVYIYHGSAQGIKTNPAQILSGKEHSIRLFGYSLAGNMDLDGNSYPDLAAGSLSDAALIYRARPVVNIRKHVTVSPEEIDLSLGCDNSFCFTVKACFKYTANPTSYSQRLIISYSIEADGERRKQGLNSRVIFLTKSNAESDFQFNDNLELKDQNRESCVPINAGLKDNIKDKMRSILIEVSAEIIEAKGKKIKNGLPPLMPVLDAAQPSRAVAEVNFLKEGCKNKRICYSNLQMDHSLHYKQISQDAFSQLPTSAHNVPQFVLSYEKKDLALKVTVTNKNGDDAYEAKLVGKFPDALSYSGVRPITQILCTANQNGSEAECELGNPFNRNSEVTFYIILSTMGITLDSTEIEIDLQLQTTSSQDISPVKVTSEVITEFPLTLSGEAKPSQVSFGGVVKAETAMKTEEEAGSLINFTFRINNLWKPLVPPLSASLHIHWPRYNKDGKWLLYLVKVTSHGPDNIICSPQSEFHSLKNIWESSPSRTKRENVEKERKLGRKVAFLSSKNKVLSCERENKCVVLKCPLQGIDGTAVELRSRLWNSTFIEDYASFPTIALDVKTSLVLSSQAQNIILKSPEVTVRVLVTPDSEVAQFGVPWWIILMAVLAGILILALMVFLLWKCGFFKRATIEQYNAAYQMAEIHVQPSDKDKLSDEA
ncbi:integrin alpha-6 isoform X3 [Girardinichthys multiradiatus]|uniref:integrin alpha-6 isoform X3 n=1 Tax=Girardinichthys multiradiatus TaxID=208333 RepID=UPI001FABC0CD|nr:integrin alpha-6 isoform X3 [Girardinichthys multiradiatus]XP_047226555.1 integrin alpha-6 isoform X3 [Girardinichthys multiradiatus]